MNSKAMSRVTPYIPSKLPKERMAQQAEIALAALFLASDAAAYITGQVISVSGGLTMHG